jgi:hypothetical protein
MGLYIVYTIHIDTSRLNNLIRLHQVEILREKFLIQIKRVQSDISLQHTQHSRAPETVLGDVHGIEGVIDVCFRCHHSPRCRPASTTSGTVLNCIRTP